MAYGLSDLPRKHENMKPEEMVFGLSWFRGRSRYTALRMRFAPEYVANVLNENFEDAKELFLGPLLAIHCAHLVMLAAQGIVSKEDARRIRAALEAIAPDQVRRAQYDGTHEDLFFFVERLIVQGCGDEAAGRLHTARSRNDIDMTMYRMRQRDRVLALLDATLLLRRALLGLADRHRETVLAVHTHTQRAQPTTVAHYLLAVVEQLERDAVRLTGAYERTNRSPLGACAITGTGFPIDRALTADLLGFSAPTVNTYGSIATVDYLLESASAAAVLLTGLGRFVQDLLLWCTSEFGYVRFGDGFVQSSSIMPQKRNPVAIEHARALGSKALGQALAIVTSVHNTPFGDIVDTEDDLQPLVFSMFRDATRTVSLLAAAMPTAEFDAACLESRAADGWTTLTELADTLVRDRAVPFRTAHAIAGRLIAARRDAPGRPLGDLLAEASRELTGAEIRYTDAALAEILSPRHFVNVRRTLGGPAPEETRRAAEASRRQLEADDAWRTAATEALAAAERRLCARAASL
jgi:argininosuccinate lyase